jgi:hypothetical protein
MSSSLAGALASPDTIKFQQDVDMHPSSFDDAPPDTATEDHLKQEEEMGDLFGEDSNVDFVHHGRLVFRRAKVTALASAHGPHLIQIVTSTPRVHRALPNQDTRPPSLHHLQMTAFLHRTENEERP